MSNTVLLSKAQQLLQAKKYFQAYNLLAKHSQKHPHDAKVWNLMGLSLAELGLNIAASNRFKRALKLDAQLVVAHKNLEQSLILAQKFQQSVQISRRSPCVSIITVTYNKWAITEQYLKSLIEKTPEINEIIVVDNHSKDETPDKLKIWQAQDPERFKIILNQENLGYAGACNQGLALARSDYLVIMNNDILVTHGWLARMLDDMEREAVWITGPAASNGYGIQTITEIPRAFIWQADLLEEYAQQRALKYKGQGQSIHRLVGFCILMHRKVIEKIGALDSRFKIGTFEDDDFCYRAHIAGFTLWWCQSSFVHHLGRVSFQTAGDNSAQEALIKNLYLFKEKWGLLDIYPGDMPDLAHPITENPLPELMNLTWQPEYYIPLPE